jgi:uncharacterized protein HemY
MTRLSRRQCCARLATLRSGFAAARCATVSPQAERLIGRKEADDPPLAHEADGALEMRPLVAHCHLDLGKLYRRTGNRQQAQEHLATATAMYREMDMRFWLEQAEAELGEGS